jgi:hypothetical protein
MMLDHYDRLALMRAVTLRRRAARPRPIRAGSPRPAIEAALREVPRRSDRAIARGIGCDHTHVGAVRQALGIPPGPRDRTKRERNAALAEVARTSTESYAAIGRRFGVDKTRANQIAIAHGVRRAA